MTVTVYAYLYRVLDEGTQQLLQFFKGRAEMAQLDFANLLKQNELAGEERENMLQALSRIGQISHALAEELDGFRCAVKLEWLPTKQPAEHSAEALSAPSELKS